MRIEKSRLKDLTHVKVSKPHSPFSGDQTYSRMFLNRMFDTMVVFDEPLYSHLVNCYTDDFGIRHEFSRPLFILMQTEELGATYSAIEALLKDNKNFVYSYPVGTNYNNYLFMYIYQCPDKFKDDYDRFMNGEYSQFSPEFRGKFAKTYANKGRAEESPLYGIINKTVLAKQKLENLIGESVTIKQEYLGKPKPEYEIFRYNQ